MNPDVYSFDFGVEADFLVLKWTRLQQASDVEARSRYPELKLRFNYREISSDTVSAMLRDLEVPQQLSQAIQTLIAAQAA